MIGSQRARRAAGLGGLVAGQSLRWAGTRAANTVRGADSSAAASERRTMATADEIVERLGSMNGAAMKLGQVLSTVDMGLVPESEREAFKTKLGALRDAAEPVAFADVRKVLEADLGRASGASRVRSAATRTSTFPGCTPRCVAGACS